MHHCVEESPGEDGNTGGEPNSAKKLKRLEGDFVVLANKLQEAKILEVLLNKDKEDALQIRVGHVIDNLNQSAIQEW